MLNFEEELKKFEPSPEIEEADNAIYQQDLTDIMDIAEQLVEASRR
ncbi:MAG: hypothetical protein IJV59_03330 [Eubacterium sp.]|nr:hypothetical protein [Eubacterium sp.]